MVTMSYKTINVTSKTYEKLVLYKHGNMSFDDVINEFMSQIEEKKFYNHVLKEHKKRRAIWNFLKNKSYFEYLNVSVGWCDLVPEFVVKNVEELEKIFNEIDISFPGAIKKWNFWITEESYKERWLPEF